MLRWLVLLSALLPRLSSSLPSRPFYASFQGPKSSLNASPSSSSSDSSLVSEAFVDATLDHFDGHNPATFKQRYFVRDSFFNQNSTTDETTYAFLCCGGEGPALEKNVLTNSVHCSGDMVELAAKLSAESGQSVMLFALEHRYYGLSYPFEDVSTPNLKFLSSRQAINDVASFVSQMNDMHGWTESSVKWVTFGGSYPGMVSAFSRLKFPHLIHASVSSSAPVQASVEMASYESVVGSDLEDSAVGGSASCLSVVSSGHADIAETLRSGDPEAVEALGSLFDVCDPASLKVVSNQRLFAGDGVIYVPAQSNDPSCDTPLCDIEAVCDSLLNGGDGNETNVERLARVAKAQRGGSCVETNWEAQVAFISSQAAKVEGTRSWLYQTCSEFGYYQTCSVDSDCPFAKGFHPLSQDLDLCAAAFGIDADQVAQNVKLTNEYYGGWNPVGGTRVLSVNGSVDPWSSLAITDDNELIFVVDDCLPAVGTEGASHHFWTHEVLPTDSAAVNKTREIIYSQVTSWLKMDKSNAC